MTGTGWIVVGASRGIGLELVSQVKEKGDIVIAVLRQAHTMGSELWSVVNTPPFMPGQVQVVECDVTNERSIEEFTSELTNVAPYVWLDNLVFTVGFTEFHSPATTVSFNTLMNHLMINAVGPIITASRIIAKAEAKNVEIKKIIFFTSQEGSASEFSFTEGFAAFAAAKAALNQMVRHLAEELKEKGKTTVVLAVYPGEVQSDDHPAGQQGGMISKKESVEGILEVLQGKTIEHSGTAWKYDGTPHPW